MRKAILLSLLSVFLVFTLVATPIFAAISHSFDYTITANGTQTVTTMPEQEFTWTVTGTGTELWYWNGQMFSYYYEMDADESTDTYYWPPGGGRELTRWEILPGGKYYQVGNITSWIRSHQLGSGKRV